MGGFGSGERWPRKARVEGYLALDTSDLKRLKLLAPGAAERRGLLTWHRGGTGGPLAAEVNYVVAVGPEAGTLRLVYRMVEGGERLDFPVPLVTTGCHLGGARWWFICPLTKHGVRCGRRVRKLYLRGRYFGCRRCHELTYASTQQSDARVYALARAGVGAMPPVAGASAAQLGLTLKALMLIEKRFQRLGV